MGAASDDYVKSLQSEVARVEAEKKAIVQEFEKVIKEEWTPELIREKIRTEILPSAWISLQDLILNSESDSTRSGLIKWAFEFASRPTANPDEDPDQELTQLLKQLAPKD